MQHAYRLGLIVSALALSSALSIAETAPAPTAAAPAVVNGITIGNEKVEFLAKQAVAAGQQDTPELRNSIRENLITSLILSQEAQKQGLEKDTDVVSSLEMSRQAILARALIQKQLKANPISDEKLKAKYEEMKPQIVSKEVMARHILVKTEDEAKKILAALKKGKKFEDLAKQSMDPGSKDKGGELGWANPSNYVPEFSEALAKLEKGQITPTAVKTNYGFHIIQKQDERENAPPMDQLKPQLQRQLESETVEAYVKALRAKADIK